jgi:putative holliday junction resolvase
MRMLAIDHGTARCGVAVCDPTGTIVRPIEPIEPPDPAAAARLGAELGAERIVVGLPVSLDGAEGEQARLARDFATRVGEAVSVPVVLYDERLTTAMASASRRSGAKAAEDSLAAAHLLDSYLAAGAPGDG